MTHGIKSAIENIKLAYLSHTPIVWLVTEDKEDADEIVRGFVSDHMGAFFKANGIGGCTECNLRSLGKNGGATPGVYYEWFATYAKSDSDSNSHIQDLAIKLERFVNCFLDLKSERDARENSEGGYLKSIAIIASPDVPSLGWLNSYIQIEYVKKPSDKDIQLYIGEFCKTNNIVISPLLQDQLIVNLRGLGMRQIAQVLERCLALEYFEQPTQTNRILEEIRSLKRQMLEGFNGLKWIQVDDDEAAGLGAITEWLNKRTDIFSDPEQKTKEGYDVPKGLLVTGIPGTGKSLMAKETSRILKLPLISMDLGDIQEGIVGKSEEHMAKALRMVDALAPCVLWIDEIEKAFSGASSSNGDGGVMRRMFGKFLTWMQEKKSFCFVVATSNDISQLPPELFRSERFDEKFFTFMPSVEECASIFVSCIKHANEKYRKSKGSHNTLFDGMFEKESYWRDWLNSLMLGQLRMESKNGFAFWADSQAPELKFFTGADISAFVKRLKFEILSKRPNGQTGVITNKELLASIPLVIKDFMPYGQTNVKDIAKCFLSLSQNRFKPASSEDSEHQIILFSDFDESRGMIRYTENKFSNDPYNQALYRCIVGAVNQRSKKQFEKS